MPTLIERFDLAFASRERYSMEEAPQLYAGESGGGTSEPQRPAAPANVNALVESSDSRAKRLDDAPSVRMGRAKEALTGILREHPPLAGKTPYHNTQTKYMTPHPNDPTGNVLYGEYTPSRKALHEHQIRSNLKEARQTDRPTLLVMGGGPATGKTTLLNNHIGQPLQKATIDADNDKNILPEYVAMRQHGVKHAATHVHHESGYIAHQTMLRAMKMGANATWDTTGDSGVAAVRERIAAAREAGPNHKIVAHYVTVPTEEALGRAKKRWNEEGRWIPTKTVKAIHANVSRIFPQIAKENLFDELHLWDTRGKFGAAPTHVASQVNGVMTIHHPQYYNEFLAKGHEGSAPANQGAQHVPAATTQPAR